LVWEYAGANKQSLTVDFAHKRAMRQLIDRIRGADVFITDWRPQRLSEAVLDFASLSASAPGLVMVQISPFGSDGPYAAFEGSDLVVQALSGMLSLSGRPRQMPLKVPGNVLTYGCGVSAFVAALAALHQRDRDGGGQLVEVACLETVASLVLFLRAQYLGEPFPRRSGVGTVVLPCLDGHLMCSAAFQPVWEALCLALEIPQEVVPDELRTPEGRQQSGRLLEFISPYTRRQIASAVFELLGTMHVVCGLVQSATQVLHDKDLRERDWFRTLDLPDFPGLAFPGPPARMSQTSQVPPASIRALAGDKEMPRAAVDPALTAISGSARDRRSPPLEGLRILDLTGAWIGPYAVTLLADLGADVIKVESPRRPDVWRIYRPGSDGKPDMPPGASPGAHPRNTSFYFNSVNRNKRGITLDLTNPRGQDVFLRLVASADVLMENFTPRVMDNFGLGYERLRAVRPDLIMASFSGYGDSGPYRDFKATGVTIEAISGWTSLFGYPDEPPMAMGEMEADPLCGLQMAACSLVALLHRDRTGDGQQIQGSMFEAAVGYIGEEMLLAALGGDMPHPRGNRDRQLVPQGVFPCAGPGGPLPQQGRASQASPGGPQPQQGRASQTSPGGPQPQQGRASQTSLGGPQPQQGRASQTSDDSWLAITVRHDADWRALQAVAADAPWLRDDRFDHAGERICHVHELEQAIARWTTQHPAAWLMSELQNAGVPAGAVLKTDEVPSDPHFVARRWFRPITHSDMGTHLYNGYPWRFSRGRLVLQFPPPRVGEHNAEVLTRLGGLTPDEYAELDRAGIVATLLRWEDAPP